ncbi:MAG: 50S ribosomal protein L11 methyltransferase [Solirubrobacteraceae bacterium]
MVKGLSPGPPRLVKVCRLAVSVRRERAELALAELLELAPDGLEEVDLGEVIEYAIYGASGELPTRAELQAAIGDALVEVSAEEIAEDWSERWRAFHRPLVLDGELTVRPPWCAPGETPIEIVIDPGQAFGTGAHATTRLCLELMLSLEPSGSFVDLGCGSGVLAIAAAKLGFAPVIALDNDPASVEATLVNAQVNGVTIDVRRFDLLTEPVPGAGIVAANLLAPLLLAWAAWLPDPAGLSGPTLLHDPTMGPDRVIAGGLLSHEADTVSAAFQTRGLAESSRRVSGEWAALLLGRGTPRGRW